MSAAILSPPDRQSPYPFLAPVANPATRTVSPLPGVAPRPAFPTHTLTSSPGSQTLHLYPITRRLYFFIIIPKADVMLQGRPHPQNTIVRPGLGISAPVDLSEL